jgi:hypothetical protein
MCECLILNIVMTLTFPSLISVSFSLFMTLCQLEPHRYKGIRDLKADFVVKR